ncbi:MAG: serine hydrolase [Candidatus Paceibacterota bacterium]
MSKGFKIALLSFVLSLPFWWAVNNFQGSLERFFYAQISEPLQAMAFVEVPKESDKPKLDIEAKSAISVKINSSGKEKTLFNKDSNEILPIASLTKLMAAVVILEDPSDYDFSKILTVSSKAESQDKVPNYGNLKAGERYSVEKLLNLTLAYSSNDAVFALAENIGVKNFVEKMNEKALELGLNNTHFVNPTGLDPEGLHYSTTSQSSFNYSTARDLYSLAAFILKSHPTIFGISLEENGYKFENGISEIVLPEDKIMLGGKTGYTDEAGGCILSCFYDKNGNHFINVVLGTVSHPERVIEMQKLVNWINS